jgi:hypothetical protein
LVIMGRLGRLLGRAKFRREKQDSIRRVVRGAVVKRSSGRAVCLPGF